MHNAEMGSSRIQLCPRCRRDVLPQLARPSWHREKHRAAATEREPAPSPAALKAARKAARKSFRAAALSKARKQGGLFRMAKVFLDAAKLTAAAPPPSLDCPDCLTLQGNAA